MSIYLSIYLSQSSFCTSISISLCALTAANFFKIFRPTEAKYIRHSFEKKRVFKEFYQKNPKFWALRKIGLIENNAKCCHQKQLTCTETLRQVFICLRPRTPYLPLTHCTRVYSILIHIGKGQSWTTEKGRGQQFTKLGLKFEHDWLYLRSINFDKHLPQSPFTCNSFQMTTFCFGVPPCANAFIREKYRKHSSYQLQLFLRKKIQNSEWWGHVVTTPFTFPSVYWAISREMCKVLVAVSVILWCTLCNN